MQPQSRTAGSRLEGRSLPEIAQLASGCQLCRLCDARTHVVFGQGAIDADLMFVAEAPGYHDDRTAMPFSGEAGALFDEMLAAIGRTRSDIYVTSLVKCRPPRNRSPFPDEIEQCEGYLFREVTLVQPRVICALGNSAIRLLSGKPLRLSDVHGQPIAVTIHERPVVVLPLFHPGATVHAPRLRRTLLSDLRQVPALLRQGMPAQATEPIEPAAPAPVVRTDSAADVQLALEIGG
jgi:uracil-DNA glycosylase